MPSKHYVFHCAKCQTMILKEKVGQKKCPVFKNRRVEGFPMTMGIPDYKRDSNYPQFCPPLGEVVRSYKDYQHQLKEFGHVETGRSEESRKRMKFMKRKAKALNTRKDLSLS